ncbi:MAG: hypothetical protein B6245_08905 [Desulfobacteraceae bacterium 4572_88]|nr:MAG: hypothetical protein B6245_08905 [Desulfobacteraceae bacterium 4572_88]
MGSFFFGKFLSSIAIPPSGRNQVLNLMTLPGQMTVDLLLNQIFEKNFEWHDFFFWKCSVEKNFSP